MYKHCITEESVKRQRELEQGLLAMMKTKFFDEISISEFCETMQIPRKTFYRYFNSKEGALFALLDHMLLDFVGSYQQNQLMDPHSTLEAFFTFWLKNKDLLTALRRSSLNSTLIQRSIEIATTELPHFERFFSIKSKYAREYGTVFLASGLMATILHWHQTGFRATPREISGIALQLMTEPMFLTSHQTDCIS